MSGQQDGYKVEEDQGDGLYYIQKHQEILYSIIQIKSNDVDGMVLNLP